MAVATGIPPRELLELDAGMFEAVLRAEAERWSLELELLATVAEISHAHLWAFLQAHSKRNLRWEPLKIERPSREEPREAPRVVPVLELAELGGVGVERREVSEP